jgi:hypothetical protein
MPEKVRPAGILVLVVLYIILAVIRLSESALWASQGEGTTALALLCLAPNVILGIMYLVVAGGLHLLKRWAWILALVFAVFGLIYAAVKLAGFGLGADVIKDLDMSTAFFAIPVISLFMNLIVLLYLVKVKEHFE